MADMSQIAQIASQYSIPPAILQAVMNQQGTSAGIPEAVLTSYGMSQSDVKNDADMQLEIIGRTLSQQFAEFGSWEKALSAYVSGDPNAYTSPTSNVGGFVYGILGTAAADPAAGMDGFSPADPNAFALSATDFGNHMQELNGMGGVVSPAHTQAWLKASSQAFQSARRGGAIEIGQGANAQGPGPGAFSGPGEDFPWGQCTWFAAGAAASWLTNTSGFGDAHNWLGAAQKNGYNTGGTPKVGAVVVYGAGGGYDAQAGHVGIVTAVNPDGTMQVTSDHWSGLGSTHIGTSTMADVEGFIYAPDDKAAQQTAETALKVSGQDPSTFAAQFNAIATMGSAQPAATLAQQQAKALGQTTPKNQPQQPGAVGEFAEQLQKANIDPDHFAQNYPHVASMYRKYMQRSPQIAEYAPMAQMSLPEMIQHILNQPHPIYPEHTVGTIAKWYDAASLHSVPNASRTPNLAEAARFASAQPKWDEMFQFYQQLGQQKQNQQTAKSQQQPPQQQPQPMGQQQQASLQRRQSRLD